jgi:outer membrane lipase/esterase
MTLGTFTAAGRRLRLSLALAAALGGAAACGGGGDTVNSFDPQRLLVFGDEASVLSGPPADEPGPGANQPAPIGSKYSINALDPVTDGTTEDLEPTASAQNPDGYGNCRSDPLWIQELADEYGFGFEQCKGDRPVRATTFAANGATVAGVKAQIDAFLRTDRFSSRDLVGIYAGLHDILEIYRGVTSASQCRYNASDPDSSGAAARAARERGDDLAKQVARVADNGNGGRVLFVTVPDVGATPFGRGENEAHGNDFDRRDCLEDLTDAFNGGLRANKDIQDGRHVGLVALDEQLDLILDEPDDWDYDNVTQAACLTEIPLDPNNPTGAKAAMSSLLKCTTATVARSGTHLWADALHFGPELHERFGELAERRADRNPF